jgi:GNAT superfamily N-acetyltransferase
LQRIRNAYRKAFENRISLICIRAGTDEVVGLNALYVKSKFDKPTPPSDDESFRILNESLDYIEMKSNIYEHYNVDHYVSAAGLCVDENYRGRGIATEILKTRAALLRAIGLKVTSAVFSTIGGQKAAHAAGYEENFSTQYEDFEKLFPSMRFSHVRGLCCKVLSLKIQ